MKDMTVENLLFVSRDANPLWIDYTNHRGIRCWRKVIANMMIFKESVYHKGRQLILLAYDLEKRDNREFAVKDIHDWRETDSKEVE